MVETAVAGARAHLHMQREGLAGEIERLRESLRTNPELVLDDGDPLFNEREQNMVLVLSFEARLAEIDAAIALLEAEVYGICEGCGEPINPERLAIMPEATLCVPCKSAQEQAGRFR